MGIKRSVVCLMECCRPSLLCPFCGADEMTDHPDGESGICDACGRRS